MKTQLTAFSAKESQKSIANTEAKQLARSTNVFQLMDNRNSTATQRKLQTVIKGSQKISQLKAFQKAADKNAYREAKVVQLARWRLISQDTWTGIDPENITLSKTHASGTHEIGSVIEDTTGFILSPTKPNGRNLPSGSYGDWRKVARSDEQVDHFPPNASYVGTKYANVSYTHRPAFPIRNREGHRPAQGEEYGYGGHVSTTNSSFVQKGYTPDLNSMMKTGDFFGAMAKELADKANVALYQYGSRAAFNELLRPAIMLSYEYKWLTEYGCLRLLAMLDRFEEYPNG